MQESFRETGEVSLHGELLYYVNIIYIAVSLQFTFYVIYFCCYIYIFIFLNQCFSIFFYLIVSLFISLYGY